MELYKDTPAMYIQINHEEMQKKIERDLSIYGCRQEFTVNDEPSSPVMFGLDYIRNRASEGLTLVHLTARGRTMGNLQKTAEAVLNIFKEQDFAVAEALLFIKYVEDLVLASPTESA